MVVLSASVCTRQGKALVSRQYVEMNRLRVEGLLAAFPKLVGHAKQHTFVETDSVRYVYQPLENQMYLLLVTTKTSNIVEDLSTLRLLAKVVPDVSGGLQEAAVSEHAFDLIFAFDEVLTAGGHREEATLSSIRTNLLMDSHEEKIHDALKQSKEQQAKDEMRQQMKKIQERQMAQLRQNFIQGGNLSLAGAGTSTSGMQGFGGGGGGPQSGLDFQQQQQQDPFAHQAPAPPPADVPKVLAKSGMKLGGGGGGGIGGLGMKKDSLMEAMAMEDNLNLSSANKNPFSLSAAPTPAAAPSTPLTLVLEEKITVQMSREGDIGSCDLKGTLTLTANTDAGTMAIVCVNKKALPSTFSYATHPRVDKKTYEKDGLLSLKGGKGFPLSRPVGILRWSSSDESCAPLTINCWPEDEGTGSINVNIEMELTRKDVVLQDVNILLPLGTTDPPVIESIDGEYKHDARAGMMCWHFDQIDANTHSTASLEYRIGGSNPDVFFPVQVGFRSETLLCPMEVLSVNHAENGTPIPNQFTKNFAPESYRCE